MAFVVLKNSIPVQAQKPQLRRDKHEFGGCRRLFRCLLYQNASLRMEEFQENLAKPYNLPLIHVQMNPFEAPARPSSHIIDSEWRDWFNNSYLLIYCSYLSSRGLCTFLIIPFFPQSIKKLQICAPSLPHVYSEPGRLISWQLYSCTTAEMGVWERALNDRLAAVRLAGAQNPPSTWSRIKLRMGGEALRWRRATLSALTLVRQLSAKWRPFPRSSSYFHTCSSTNECGYASAAQTPGRNKMEHKPALSYLEKRGETGPSLENVFPLTRFVREPTHSVLHSFIEAILSRQILPHCCASLLY